MNEATAVPLDALVLGAWSRVWSPLAPKELFEESWRALDLPDDCALRDAKFCSTFHAGFPAPPVTLLLHAALNRSSDEAHSDILRAMSHLDTTFGEHVLPPDHLAIVCEVVACAIAKDEMVIADTIRDRYMRPWCEYAMSQLADDDLTLRDVVESFHAMT